MERKNNKNKQAAVVVPVLHDLGIRVAESAHADFSTLCKLPKLRDRRFDPLSEQI